MENITCLVTGSAGFIGSHLVKELRKIGCKVIEFDLGDKLPKGGVDVVYHLAANANAYDSVSHPEKAFKNLEIMFKVLEWMRKTGTKKIIFTSSREAFSLVNPYGASKLACENLIEPYCKTFGFAAISARLANVSGKGNLSYRFIENTIEKSKKGEDIEIYGDKVLNFINIEECIQRLIDLRYDLVSGKNLIREVANRRSFKLKVVAERIIKITRSNSKIVMKENRLGETLEYYPRQVFNLIQTSIDEIIQRCL
jgi:UDP-glucose 4-epimerase